MDAMPGYLLEVRSVRREVDRREACGQWVSGSSGEGGAFAMRTPEEKARRAAAGSDDEVRPLLSPLTADAQHICAPMGACRTAPQCYRFVSMRCWVVYAVRALWICCSGA